MFDVDELVSECRAAFTDPHPRLAIKELLARAVHQPAELLRALPLERAEVVPLFVSDELSLLKVVWAPGMSFRPHNHLMWAVIGLYCGQEDNTFYKCSDQGPVVSGRLELTAGDVALLGADAIHMVTNPKLTFTGAIHVYGGDITSHPGRSEWEEDTLAEVPYDFARVKRCFEEANRSQSRSGEPGMQA